MEAYYETRATLTGLVDAVLLCGFEVVEGRFTARENDWYFVGLITTSATIVRASTH